MLKKIGYGIVLWAIPYVTSIPLLGLNQSDQLLFKTIMIVEGSIVGAILAAAYFMGVKRDFLRDGIVVGIVWIVVSWILDYGGVVYLSGMTLDRYFMEIGLRYIAMAAPTVAIGYVLEKRLAAG
jgi:uncharacterized membrane protein YpjA